MSVHKRNNIWQVSFRYKGCRIRRSAGAEATRQDALELETQLRHQMRMEANGGSSLLGKRTLEEGMQLWLTNEVAYHRNPEKAKSHARNARPYLRGILLQDAEIAAERMKADLLEKGRSASTINNRLWVFRRCLAAAAKEGWISKGAKNEIKNIRTSNERHVYLSRDQVDDLRSEFKNEECGRAMYLAAYTGLRRSELLRLTSENVNDKGHIVLGTETKSRRPRVIPVPEFIKQDLLPLPLQVGDSQLRGQWEKARSACNLEHVRWHDLRHTYASWLVKSGAPLAVVRDLLGHKDFSTTSRYVTFETKFLEESVALLDTKAATQKSKNG